MLNDRDEKHEDESEYHFSDEDASYEVEPEPQKQAPAPSRNLRENVFSRLSQSKRMLISIVVFLILVFVAYKMVAPSQAPSTDITAAPATPSQSIPVSNKQMSVNQPQMAATKNVPAQPAIQPPPMTPTAGNVALPPPTSQPGATPTMPVAPQRVVAEQPGAAQQLPQQPGTPAEQQQNMQIVAKMPTVIPVKSTTNTAIQQGTVTTQSTKAVETGMANMSAISQQLINQLEAEYSQKVNDFANQNKLLQEQVQTLNSRVANMELQLNQLVQALTHQVESGGASGASGGGGGEVASSQASEARMPYTVQAIIPGRAWLRSDNGETVTVAEGDVIRGLGRVTKIDPYDGVVQVNTGNKVVSLSYGNGG